MAPVFVMLCALLPNALGLAPGTWAGRRPPRAGRVVAIEAPPPAGFVWGSAVDEPEQLASTTKAPIKGANGMSDEPAEAANKLKVLQEQGLRTVQARADSQKGCATWAVKAEKAEAAAKAKAAEFLAT